jgi:hypothetical protein
MKHLLKKMLYYKNIFSVFPLFILLWILALYIKFSDLVNFYVLSTLLIIISINILLLILKVIMDVWDIINRMKTTSEKFKEFGLIVLEDILLTAECILSLILMIFSLINHIEIKKSYELWSSWTLIFLVFNIVWLGVVETKIYGWIIKEGFIVENREGKSNFFKQFAFFYVCGIVGCLIFILLYFLVVKILE